MGEVSYLPLIEDMTWSYSRIETFDSCPYKWFLKYICECESEDKFYATFGTYMHRLIERYYRGELSKDDMLMEYLSGFSDNVKGARPKTETMQKYIQCGAEYLRNFQPFPYDMVDVEKRVEFQINDINFVGVIDYLGEKDGEYYIVDNKSRDLKPRSNRKKQTAKDKELDSMLKQLYLYAAAVKQEYGKFPKALCFNCFKTGTFIEEPFDINAYDKAIEWALSKINEIKETDDFYPILEFFPCHYICSVSSECIYDQMARGAK